MNKYLIAFVLLATSTAAYSLGEPFGYRSYRAQATSALSAFRKLEARINTLENRINTLEGKQ